MITNRESGTRIDEIAAGIYRISTPLAAVPGGFTFNQYLVADEGCGPIRRRLCSMAKMWLSRVAARKGGNAGRGN